MVPIYGPYPSADALTDRWLAWSRAREAVVRSAGRSVEGRELLRIDVPGQGPRVMLTALIHGTEVIGSLALLRALERMSTLRPLTILPIVNPDALHANMNRLQRGLRASQRCNANGVDLNRNFPRVTDKTLYHPFAGSRFRWSPHYVGVHPLSEPESRAVVEVAREVRPAHAIGFHSFGNMLLYPWAHTRDANPRAPSYRARGARFASQLRGEHYTIAQAIRLYPTIGDLDDWMDHELSTLAFTIEVGSLDRRLLTFRRAINPFCWMNPSSEAVVEKTIEELAPAVAALAA